MEKFEWSLDRWGNSVFETAYGVPYNGPKEGDATQFARARVLAQRKARLGLLPPSDHSCVDACTIAL